jgi:tetratricopeptide (TPR) repeat protein
MRARRPRLAALRGAACGLVLAGAVAAAAAQETPLQPAPASDLSSLAEDERWDDLMAAADARLDKDPQDNLALYWKGRATVETARPLLSGRSFARDLAHTMLRRAREMLEQVRETPGDATADAREWLAWSRYLQGVAQDGSLPADLEQWYARDGRGYAAYLRGVIAGDRGEAGTAEWFAKAAAASPDRPEFARAWAEALAGAGQRDAALAAWEQARAAGSPLPDLLSTLAIVLPGAENAAARLQRLDAVAAAGAAGDGLLQWHRAHALEELGRRADAEAALAGATTNRTPGVERAHARLLRLLGRAEEAAPHLLPGAQAGDDASLQALIDVADSLARDGRFDSSLATYDAAVAIEPNDERAVFNRALTLSLAGRGVDAMRALLKRWPDRADMLNNVALVELGWGHRDEARALLERAVELDGAVDARENLAQMLLENDPPDAAAALPLLDAVLAENPKRDRALELRGLARAASGVPEAPR